MIRPFISLMWRRGKFIPIGKRKQLLNSYVRCNLLPVYQLATVERIVHLHRMLNGLTKHGVDIRLNRDISSRSSRRRMPMNILRSRPLSVNTIVSALGYGRLRTWMRLGPKWSSKSWPNVRTFVLFLLSYLLTECAVADCDIVFFIDAFHFDILIFFWRIWWLTLTPLFDNLSVH